MTFKKEEKWMQKILIGVATAAVVNVASASNALLIEKQQQAETISKLLDGITVSIKMPECTIKQS
ncbi:hypothetical protein [Legionella tunisiensis]|uniref:hypothetical protein n=1 Tax=Legionella tunisiensis TaxID=1034944 RepID=UPI00037E80CE|nr:hypothetical protein [Legionella tunisiensis]